MMHGGRVVARAIKNEGIDHVFTLCGGHVQNIYDGCLDEGVRVVDVRHEQTAGHAADGWARVTGRPGVAIVTAGPGVTDVVTAVANAKRAGVPLLVLGGAGPIVNRHMGSLQDMDHVELMRPITKWSATVTETRRLEEMMTMAFRAATTGVPGPVFLEVPLDVLMTSIDDAQLVRPTGYRTTIAPAPDPEAIAQAAEWLDRAERPMLIVGSQLRWSSRRDALRDFLAHRELPTYANGMARGAVARESPCYFMHTRSWALKRADVVLVFGTPFDFRLKYGNAIPKETKVVQVDLDANEIGRNRHVHLGIPADSSLALQALTSAVSRGAGGEWLAEVRAEEDRRLQAMQAEITSESDPPNPLRVCSEVAGFLEQDSIVVGDGGDFVATAAYTMPIEWPGIWMDPGPLGTLGVGPGYAMAAKLAFPDRRVVLMYGDGSFGLHAMEWEAMARQGIPVVGVVGNDAAWTQIRRGQRVFFGEDRCVATGLRHTRYDQVVEACGGKGYWVERCADLRPALESAFASGAPALVNVHIGKSDFRSGAISV